ncbi:MAG: MAPEG family protein [Chloroflexota bacterium]
MFIIYLTPMYAAVFGLALVILSVRTLWLRRQLGVAIGSGDNPLLARAARVHSNFTEYVPISLLLIYFLEIQSGGGMSIHGLCILLLVGRIIHAIGVSQVKEDYRFRTVGMALTLIVIISVSIRLLTTFLLANPS